MIGTIGMRDHKIFFNEPYLFIYATYILKGSKTLRNIWKEKLQNSWEVLTAVNSTSPNNSCFFDFSSIWRYKPTILSPPRNVVALVCRENTWKFEICDLKFLRGLLRYVHFLLNWVKLKLVWVFVNVKLQENLEGIACLN